MDTKSTLIVFVVAPILFLGGAIVVVIYLINLFSKLAQLTKSTPLRDVFFSFQGRIGRDTYWLLGIAWLLFVAFIGGCISNMIHSGTSGLAGPLVAFSLIPCTWMAFALQAKRWHDLGRSGWAALIGLVPVIGLLVAVFFLGFARGSDSANEYGNAPIQTPDERSA